MSTANTSIWVMKKNTNAWYSVSADRNKYIYLEENATDDCSIESVE